MPYKGSVECRPMRETALNGNSRYPLRWIEKKLLGVREPALDLPRIRRFARRSLECPGKVSYG
jgi:hypothetical protein